MALSLVHFRVQVPAALAQLVADFGLKTLVQETYQKEVGPYDTDSDRGYLEITVFSGIDSFLLRTKSTLTQVQLEDHNIKYYPTPFLYEVDLTELVSDVTKWVYGE